MFSALYGGQPKADRAFVDWNIWHEQTKLASLNLQSTFGFTVLLN